VSGKGEEEELDSINSSINAILKQYEIIPEKEKKVIIKRLEKENRGYAKEWEKTQEAKLNWKIARNDVLINKLVGQTNRIGVRYGIAQFNIDVDYFLKIEDKEQYLDGLFNRSMKKILQETEAPKNIHQAKSLEGLITQYSKKISDTKFYDEELVENSINKLTNFRNTLTEYDYSDYIDYLRYRKELKNEEGYEDYTDEEWENEFEEVTGIDIDTQKYKAIEKPILIDGWLIGLELNFF
jgi:hypothetical protein